MNTNDMLLRSVNRLMNNGLSEHKAWMEAYLELVNEGVLTNLHVIPDDGSDPLVRNFYIFAHSTTDDKDYTYLSARYCSSDGMPISIGLYDKFFDYVADAIEDEVEDKNLKKDMLDGLSMLFVRICEDYVAQMKQEVNDRLDIYCIDKAKHGDYRTRVLLGMRDIFRKEDWKHISLNVDENTNSKLFRGVFKISNLSIDPCTIYWDIEK